MDRILDSARTGPLYLRRPEIANLVVESILYHQQGLNHYQLHAYVVMANHVHLLITPSVAVSKAMHSLKRFTVRKANEFRKLTGRPFWEDESYDHLVRDQIEFGKIAHYGLGWLLPLKRSSGPAPGPFANRPAG